MVCRERLALRARKEAEMDLSFQEVVIEAMIGRMGGGERVGGVRCGD